IGFTLKKNSKIVQEGNSADMIFGFDELISYITRFITLKTGDLIFTGTPSGVGEVKKGDELTGIIMDEEFLKLKIK
ncbi:MAG: fumarylacetoacetate hydrolase family protein, partial [Flavobacteriales bacterium]